MRREYFYAIPTEARDHLKALTGDLLQFNDQPEAVKFTKAGSLAAMPVRKHDRARPDRGSSHDITARTHPSAAMTAP
jgi:hypothetical protein